MEIFSGTYYNAAFYSYYYGVSRTERFSQIFKEFVFPWNNRKIEKIKNALETFPNPYLITVDRKQIGIHQNTVLP